MMNKLRAAEIKEHFGDKPFTSDDLYRFYAKNEPDLKKTTYRWRVYTLKKGGVINVLKSGVYSMKSKRNYEPLIDGKLFNVFAKVKNRFPYVCMAIWETSWLNNYMVHQPFSNSVILEVEREAAPTVFAFLQEAYTDVYLNPGKFEIENYIIAGQNNIIIKNLTVTSPLAQRQDLTVPTIEKIMVDIFTEDEFFVTYQGTELQNIFREFFKTFNINQSKLRQYANKRHVRDRLISFLKEDTGIEEAELFI